MQINKKNYNIKLHGLYAITDETLMPAEYFAEMAEAALAGGISVLQYRDKSTDSDKRLFQARTLKKLCLQYGAIFIINDDIKLAKKVDADGVHIGKNDQPFSHTRKEMGPDKIIGVTCYNQLELANDAITEGADYIAFGSFFSSSIKPDAPQATTSLIKSIKQYRDIPVCCIGGITRKNHRPLLEAGADMLAVISDIFSQPSAHEIEKKCHQFIFPENFPGK